MAYKGSCKILKNTATYEPIFVLVARDVTAPARVRDWAVGAREIGGVPKAKIKGAMDCADSMEAWQRDHGSKVPD